MSKISHVFIILVYITSRQEFIIKEGREGEYPTLTIACTSALRKVCCVNCRVLSFCIKIYQETNNLLIDVDTFVYVDINITSFMLGRGTSEKH